MDCKVSTPQSCAAKAPSCHVRCQTWCREIFRLRFAALEMTGKQESLSPHGLRRRKALLDLPLCHIVMLSIQLNQPLAASPFHRLRGSPPPWMGEARGLQRGRLWRQPPKGGGKGIERPQNLSTSKKQWKICVFHCFFF